MASRLPVVIAQQGMRSAVSVEFEEKLVAELMFAAGLDVSLIASLPRLVDGGTDHLCLEGFLGNFALCGWDGERDTINGLNRLRIAGQFVIRRLQDHPKEMPLELKNNKRIYYYDLHAWMDLPALMSDLRELLEVRSVQVIPISLTRSQSKPSLIRGPSKSLTDQSVSHAGPLSVDSQDKLPLAKFVPPASRDQSEKVSVELESDEPEWEHLDQLIDDLDASSL